MPHVHGRVCVRARVLKRQEKPAELPTTLEHEPVARAQTVPTAACIFCTSSSSGGLHSYYEPRSNSLVKASRLNVPLDLLLRDLVIVLLEAFVAGDQLLRAVHHSLNVDVAVG